MMPHPNLRNGLQMDTIEPSNFLSAISTMVPTSIGQVSAMLLSFSVCVLSFENPIVNYDLQH